MEVLSSHTIEIKFEGFSANPSNLSITLLICEMTTILQWFEHSLALPFFGIGMKADIYQSCGIAEFSTFAGILSAALLQHYLLGDVF